MSFIDWLFSNRPEGFEMKNKPWGILHILVLTLVVIVTVLIVVLFKNKSNKVNNYLQIFYFLAKVPASQYNTR